MKRDIASRCINCHFLCRVIQTSDEDGEVNYFDSTIDNRDRQELITDNNSQKKSSTLKCHFGVLNELISGRKNRNYIFEKNMRDFCFFWPYHEGMSVEAAKILQKREADIKALAKSRFWTALSVIIAGLALIVQGLPYILKLFKIKL